MRSPSILNDVLGPIMRGPSSSHTAGSFHIATIARQLLGERPTSAVFRFDPDGSFAKVFHQQMSDHAFAAGLMSWAITDNRFLNALDKADLAGINLQFKIQTLPLADHPNIVAIELVAKNNTNLSLVAKSTGGGAFSINRINEWSVNITGSFHEFMVQIESYQEERLREIIKRREKYIYSLKWQRQGESTFFHAQLIEPMDKKSIEEIESLEGFYKLWKTKPIFFIKRGDAIFKATEKIVALAMKKGRTMSQMALAYESELLGLDKETILDEILHRFDIMNSATKQGLSQKQMKMRFLKPSAGQIFSAAEQGQLFGGGFHTKVAARALAACHTNSTSGIVCAAPTAGAVGVLPGVMVTLLEDRGIDRKEIASGLLAAGLVGLIVAMRSTFAAEVAGCQVEIGVAGAMAAAAVVEIAGGDASQASAAAAIALQNSMGSICDLVGGCVEIPCHTRNAVAASNAFICADLILGGYKNPIPLDETIDAVHTVGLMLPTELKCTALGGLAQTPSAIYMTQGDRKYKTDKK